MTVTGLADGDDIKVTNTMGYTVYNGIEHDVDLDAAGVYIIKGERKDAEVQREVKNGYQSDNYKRDEWFPCHLSLF